MASGQITLFDLRSQEPCRTWSLNPWKTRLVLNYKGLDYKTEWLDYPEIKPRFEGNVAPNAEGVPYTIPTAILADGTWLMDSRPIADALERLHPSPALHLASPYQARVDAAVPRAFEALRPILYARVPQSLLTPPSAAYWHPSRAARVGMPLDEFEATRGGEAAYGAAEAPLRDVSAMLREGAGGPFFQGAAVSYADFVWVAFLVFVRRVGRDVYEEVLRRTGDREVHEKLVEACGPWLERDDH